MGSDLGNVERYGLLALFVLCALIVGVGVFGNEGEPQPWQPAPVTNGSGGQPANHVGNGEGVVFAPGPGEGLTKVERRPNADRDHSFEDDNLVLEDDLRSEMDNGSGNARNANARRTGSSAGNGAGSNGGGGNARRTEPKPRALPPIVVRGGDSLWKIAKRELGSVKHLAALKAANPGVGDRIKKGQKLVRPRIAGVAVKPQPKPRKRGKVRTHVVRKGDNLTKIAKRYYSRSDEATLRSLAKANSMGLNDPVVLNKKLLIPDLASSRD